jgi:hypothetical protein
MPESPSPTVAEFPKKPQKSVSSRERTWGKPVLSHGCAAMPSILIQA